MCVPNVLNSPVLGLLVFLLMSASEATKLAYVT